jgi:hypothetical protein
LNGGVSLYYMAAVTGGEELGGLTQPAVMIAPCASGWKMMSTRKDNHSGKRFSRHPPWTDKIRAPHRLVITRLRVDDLVPQRKPDQIAQAREVHLVHDVTAVAYGCPR